MHVSSRIARKSHIYASVEAVYEVPEPEVQRLPLAVSALILMALSSVSWVVIFLALKLI